MNAKQTFVKKTYKIFVSSTFIDLRDHRDYVIDKLQRAGLYVDPMEMWSADEAEPKRLSVDRLENCDICVLLVAFRRGYVPKNEKKSITQFEYESARERGIAILPFLLRDSAKWYAQYNELEKDVELVAWREQLQEEHTVSYFDDTPTSVEVLEAITRYAIRRLNTEHSSGNYDPKTEAFFDTQQRKAKQSYMRTCRDNPDFYRSFLDELLRRSAAATKLFDAFGRDHLQAQFSEFDKIVRLILNATPYSLSYEPTILTDARESVNRLGVIKDVDLDKAADVFLRTLEKWDVDELDQAAWRYVLELASRYLRM